MPLRAPRPHRGEGVPEVAFVELFGRFHPAASMSGAAPRVNRTSPVCHRPGFHRFHRPDPPHPTSFFILSEKVHEEGQGRGEITNLDDLGWSFPGVSEGTTDFSSGLQGVSKVVLKMGMAIQTSWKALPILAEASQTPRMAFSKLERPSWHLGGRCKNR